MRSGNIVSENSEQIYVVPHLKTLIVKRKEGKKKGHNECVLFLSPARHGLLC